MLHPILSHTHFLVINYSLGHANCFVSIHAFLQLSAFYHHRDIAKRERLFRKAKHSNCNDHLLQFKNSVVNKIRNAKRSFSGNYLNPAQPTNLSGQSLDLWTHVKSLTSGILSYGTVSVTNIQQQGLMELQPGCCILSQKLSPHPYLPFLISPLEQKNYHRTGSCLMWCQYLRRLHCAMMFILFSQYHYSRS